MSTRQTRDLPTRLEKVRQRFEHSRRTRKPRSRIPDSLWSAAVKMARTYGIHRTARALQVDYYSLKKRVGEESGTDRDRPMPTLQARCPAAARAVSAGVSEGGEASTFLELALPLQPGPGECTLELEGAGGAKMRVHLKGFEAPDLAALSRSFWNPGP
jgi:hypothetical protein